MDRRERLQNLLEFIEQHDREHHFDYLYAKVQNEYDTEFQLESDLKKNTYLNNLRQTMEKQAREYTEALSKRPKKGAPAEFRSFRDHFLQDVREALRD